MKPLPLICSIALVCNLHAGADTVALWTFEPPNVPPTVTGMTVGGILPALGSGSASAFHNNSATVFSTAAGNGSSNSFSADHFSIGDYWQFHVSTLGFQDIHLSWDQTANANGPTNCDLRYSTDGVSFTTLFSHYQVLQNSTGFGGGGGVWNPTNAFSSYSYSLDLSSVTGLDNVSDVYFRIVANVVGPFSSGTGRVDNFDVTATLVPEPRSLLPIGLATLAFLHYRRRRQAAQGAVLEC